MNGQIMSEQEYHKQRAEKEYAMKLGNAVPMQNGPCKPPPAPDSVLGALDIFISNNARTLSQLNAIKKALGIQQPESCKNDAAVHFSGARSMMEQVAILQQEIQIATEAIANAIGA